MKRRVLRSVTCCRRSEAPPWLWRVSALVVNGAGVGAPAPPAERPAVEPRPPAAPRPPAPLALEPAPHIDGSRHAPSAFAASLHVDDCGCFHGAHHRSPPKPIPGPRGTRFTPCDSPACRVDREATPRAESSRKRMVNALEING